MTDCPICKHLSCVCHILFTHDEHCKYRRSATCAIPVECEHGLDVCPDCDPCTCGDDGDDTLDGDLVAAICASLIHDDALDETQDG